LFDKIQNTCGEKRTEGWQAREASIAGRFKEGKIILVLESSIALQMVKINFTTGKFVFFN